MYPTNDWRDYIEHSARGQTWKNHKYIAIRNGRYIYPEDNKPTTFMQKAQNALYNLEARQVQREANAITRQRTNAKSAKAVSERPAGRVNAAATSVGLLKKKKRKASSRVASALRSLEMRQIRREINNIAKDEQYDSSSRKKTNTGGYKKNADKERRRKLARAER